MNFDIFINIHQSKKIELTLSSKVFVNISSLDSGPRAQVEAFQLNTPVLSVPHIGSSDLIEIGRNGEIAENLDDIPNKLKIMLDNYDRYSLKNTFNKYLKSDDDAKFSIQNIKNNFNKKLNAQKALITGVSGQDGAYLSKLLLKGYDVIGGDRRAASNTFGVKKIKILKEIEIISLIFVNNQTLLIQ